MRDPQRLRSLYDTLELFHSLYYPDLRFGQLIALIENQCGLDDLFYLEDNEIIRIIDSLRHKLDNGE